MIYECIPYKDTKRLTGLGVIFLSAAVGFFLFPSLYPDMSLCWLFQISGTLCLTVGILIYTRYVGRSYIYRIIEGDEGLDFTVTEVTGGGKSAVTVCKLSLDGIESAWRVREDTEGGKRIGNEVKKRVRAEKCKRFAYCAEPMPADSLWVIARVGGEPICVRLSFDGGLYGYFREAIDKSVEA